ncbi:MAG: elongation factor G [Deltaproteobacteria bacterium]|nr:elongation factor G [Deltaproteobacteria bacterium]
MSEHIAKLRNIALIGHGGSGKTSAAEVMLFKAGVTNRIGRIESGNTVMDFEPEELKRGGSINSSFYQFEWKKHIINLIDTPGDQNFFSDTKLCLEAADAAVTVIDGIDGVKVQTEQAWKFADEYQIPKIIFINKLDKEHSDFEKTIEDIKKSFPQKIVITQIPIGKEAEFNGIADLITNKAYIYDDAGELTETEIPDSVKDAVTAARETFIEDIAEADDTLIEKYLEGKSITDEKIKTALKQGTVNNLFVPVLCGSATGKTSGVGIELLLNFISSNMPSPIDRCGKTGTSDEQEIKKKPDQNAPFSAFVFKTIADPYAGRLTLFKVISGKLGKDGGFFNATKDTKEKFSQLLTITGKEQKPVESAEPGSIAAVAKLKETTTGDTLCDENEKIIYQTAKPIPPIISYAITSKVQGEEDKIFSSLAKIIEEDSGLTLGRNSETKEILLSGCGQVHIEVALEKLKRKFKVEAVLNIPKIPYKETIKKKVRVQGKHKKQSGGHGQYGDCWIKFEPKPRGEGFEFTDKIVGGAIPKTYIPAVEKGIIEASQKGTLAGFPCVDFKAILDDGTYHNVDSSEMAFKIAASLAFKKAMEEAMPILLEPIMKITITTPDEYMGDIMGDLNSKRGKVLGMDSKGKNQVIIANVPIAEFQTYAPTLRSITGGRGVFTLEFSHYDEVPAQETQKVIEAVTKEEE